MIFGIIPTLPTLKGDTLRKSITASFITVMAMAISCSGGGTAGPQWLIETLLSSDQVPVGTTVTVTCELTGDDDSSAIETEVVVTPTEGVTLDGHELSSTVIGDYEVACKVVGTELVDPTPALLNVFSADPVRVTAILDEGTAPAGTDVGVTCLVEDEFGNVLEDMETSIDPVEGLEIDDHTVQSTIPGDYEINCTIDDAEGEYEKIPDTLTVVAGDPVKVVVIADPAWLSFSIGDTVALSYEAYDAWDNLVEGLSAKLEAPEEGVKDLGEWNFEFEAEGAYPFTVTLASPFEDVSGTLTLYCDQSPPDIVIFFPDRGMTFDGDPLITVRGQVTDSASEVTGVTINGEAVETDGEGIFEYPVDSVHGLNPIVVTASDEFGHGGKVTRGWYYSTSYLPVPDPAVIDDVVIPEAAAVFIGQDALDDGIHDPAQLNDIATIVEVLLGGIDIASLLGGSELFTQTFPDIIAVVLPIQNVDPGLFGDLIIEIAVNDIVLGLPYVGLQSLDGGIDAEITFQPVAFYLDISLFLNTYIGVNNPLDGQYYELPLLTPGITTTSGLSIGKLGLQIVMDIEKLPGQPLTAEGKNFGLEITDIQIDLLDGLEIDLGELDLFGLIIDLGTYNLDDLVGGLNDLISDFVLDPLLNFVTQPLIDLLEPLVTTLLGDLIEQVMGILVLDTSFQIPELLGLPATELFIKTDLSSVIFKDDGARAGLNLGTLTEKGVDREPLGVILRDGCNHEDPEAPLYEFLPPPALQLGLKYDAVNEILFMLWWSGMISGELDLSELLAGAELPIPITDIVVTPGLLLPPIIDDCNPDGNMKIQMGDAYLDMTFNLLNEEQHIGLWLQLELTGAIAAAGSQIGIKIEGLTSLETEIIDIGGNMGELLGLVEGLIPLLTDLVKDQEFMFDVPSIELDGLIPGLPPGTALTLGNFTSVNDQGLAVIGTDLL